MKYKKNKSSLLIVGLVLLTTAFGCKDDKKEEPKTPQPQPTPSQVIPVDINDKGFDLLSNMQGQWVGRNQVLSWDFEWFSLDYRAISSSHTFGIFEGGGLGNLFTSFFVTDFKNTRTIMARNGGVLSGIYRTSYFVLDSVRSNSNGDYYRLVDAKGGTDVMYMELRFVSDSLYFNAYTSRLGESSMPSRHMTYKAVRNNESLAQTAATTYGFPVNKVEKDFSNGFNEAYFYVRPGATEANSASFLQQTSSNEDVYDMAYSSGDPYTIDEHVTLDTLRVGLVKNSTIDGANILLYLSRLPLTDDDGLFEYFNFNSILQFPDLGSSLETFRFTYLHQGQYYITAIADMDGDGSPSTGDYSNVSQKVEVGPSGQHQIDLDKISVLN